MTGATETSRRNAPRNANVALVVSLASFVVASGGLYLGVRNMRTNEEILQLDTEIELAVEVSVGNEFVITNLSPIDAVQVEISTTTFFYSPRLDTSFGTLSDDARRPKNFVARLSPYERHVTPELNLRKPPAFGRGCIKGSPCDSIVSEGDVGEEAFSPICTEAEPCLSVILVEVSARHPRTLRRSGPFRAYFGVDREKYIVNAYELGKREGDSFIWDDPRQERAFVRFAEWLRDGNLERQRNNRMMISDPGPFWGLGLYRATGVEEHATEALPREPVTLTEELPGEEIEPLRVRPR